MAACKVAAMSGVSGSENACGKAFEIGCPFFVCDGCPVNPKEQSRADGAETPKTRKRVQTPTKHTKQGAAVRKTANAAKSSAHTKGVLSDEAKETGNAADQREREPSATGSTSH